MSKTTSLELRWWVKPQTYYKITGESITAKISNSYKVYSSIMW